MIITAGGRTTYNINITPTGVNDVLADDMAYVKQNVDLNCNDKCSMWSFTLQFG